MAVRCYRTAAMHIKAHQPTCTSKRQSPLHPLAQQHNLHKGKFQHNSEFRVICLLQKETLKLDLSITFVFVFETEHEFRLSDL